MGAAVAATDANTDDRLTYSLAGTDAAAFDIDSASGQIRTKTGVTYDHEAQSSYSVTVSVTDGRSTVTIAVTITVTDVAEPPNAPDAPGIFPLAGAGDTLDVNWTTPDNTGRPDITDYDVRYSVDGSGTWIDLDHTGTALVATITGLDARTDYEVQVRATNVDGTSDWSDSGRATTPMPTTMVPPDWSLTPGGLAAGDTFRLLFATSTTSNATSTDIADYNSFVQTAAAAGHADIQTYGSGFTVVASTAAVDARDNTGTTHTSEDQGVPIYWLGGSKAADHYADFYDGTWDDEANAKNESGNARTLNTLATWPFTGSVHNGTEAFSSGNSRALGAGTIRVGRPNSSGSGDGPIGGGASIGQPGDSRPLYALSAVFMVSSDTSVPSNWSLIPTGLTNGDRFRLLFISSTTTDASSADIADYNSFVQTAAAAGHADIQDYSDSFHMVGSTETVDARDNTATNYTNGPRGVPIYWLNGAKLADDYPDFYDGSWDDEAAGRSEAGAEVTLTGSSEVWTGSAEDGTKSIAGNNTSRALGNGGFQWVRVGRPNHGSNGPIQGSISPRTENKGVYALSAVFTVASQVVATNSAPVFSDGASAARSVAENSDAETNVGDAVGATDIDTGDTLAYSLGGTDATSFTIDDSGQIRTKSGETYDFETQSTYSVEVSVTDGADTVTIAVTITVTDVDEPPAAPAAPTVSATAGTSDSLDVSWTAPDNTGPDITDYDVQYSVDGSETWIDAGHTGTGLSATVTDLAAGTAYAVQVRATNDEGAGAWSDSGLASTDVVANNPPVFTDGASAARSVAENSAGSANVGAAVTATDANGDTLEYSLGGTDASSFDIVSSSGQIQTISGVTYDFETKPSYSVEVSVTDGTDTVTIAVTITLTDVAAAKPGTPVVTPSAGGSDSLFVSWTASSANGGRPVDGYWIRYRKGTNGSWTQLPNAWDATSATITGLEAATEYQVQVQARTDETPNDSSDWSDPGTGTTSAATTAADVTLVSNFAESAASGVGIGNSGQITTAFTTGSHSSGYAIDSVSVELSRSPGEAANSAIAVTIRGDSSGTPGDTLITLTPPTGTVPTEVTAVAFTAPAGSTLAPATTYFLVAAADTGEVNVHTTTSDSDASDFGWSIADGGRYASTGSNWADRTYSISMKVEGGLAPLVLPANWALIPDGLTVGDKFRLLFATSATRNAASTDIGVYNDWVQAQAAAGHDDIQAYSAGFTVVASTPDTDARDNTETTYTDDYKGPPIYWLDGAKIADDYEDFYDGSWDDEANPKDESGTARMIFSGLNRPYTGSNHDGTESIFEGDSYALGATGAGVAIARPNNSAVAAGPLSSDLDELDPSTAHPFYALSQVFVVGSEVTVPSNWSLNPTGLITGDSFRLLFATSTRHPASSATITGYNTIVQNAAAGGHADIQAYSSWFRAVGSTADTDARDNTGTTTTDDDKGVPIHWLGGSQVADDYDDFYDGNWDDEANAKDESGNARDLSGNDTPWTGSENDGTEAFSPTKVSRALGSQFVVVGKPNNNDANEDPLNSTDAFTRSSPFPLYALSAVLKVGSQVVNYLPVFADGASAARSVAENSAAGTNVGTPVAATDTGDTLTYTLGGTDASSFDIVSSSGQIRTKSGETYDHETQSTYSVDVSVADGTDTVTIAVTITVTDVDEPPAAPDAPTVSATAGTTDSLDVSWTAPDNAGKPAIDNYDLQYRVGTSGSFTAGPQSQTGLIASIGSLTAGTSYEVQVRAHNDEGDGPWSASGTGSTSTNAAPVFSPTTATRNIAENTAADTNVGAVIHAATDTDASDTLTYSMEGADAASFTFDAATRQIKTKDGVTYDFEADSSYSVTIKVSDGTDTDTVAVTVSLTDVAEPPAAPDAPTVSATASTTDSLDVGWTAPDNTGPDITDYDVQYSVAGSGTWTDAGHTGTGLAATLAGLAAGTTYEVQVQATNDEGTGAWSDSGTGTTTAAPVTLVSNFAQAHPSAIGVRDSRQLATAFTTGSYPGGYAIDSVSLRLSRALSNPSNSTIAVTIRADSSGTPGDTLITLTRPSGTIALSAATVAFTAPAGSTLAPATTYFLVAAPANGNVNVHYTTSDSDASDFGWSIAEGSRYASTGSDWADRAYPISMKVDGGLAPFVLPADSALVPSGLAAGDKFRLLFATSTTRDGSSSAIADYNTHVQNAAAAGHDDIQDYSAAFRAVASTDDDDARDNTETTHTTSDKGLPIYWLGGSQAADDYEDFYDGSWDDEANPKDEDGNARTLSAAADLPFTGSVNAGTASLTALGSTTVTVGKPDSSTDGEDPIESSTAAPQADTRPFYALSPVFTVGPEITVPADWSLKPTALTTGDRFRLLFLTYAGHSPTSTDIATYNTYIQSQANAGNAHAAIKPYSAWFRVVGSTASTDARDNTGTTFTAADKGVPIYWLNGNKVVDDYEDFYDGDWDDEANPRERSGTATAASVDRVWTGSTKDGTEKFNDSNVSNAFGAAGGQLVGLGWLNNSDSVIGPLDSGEAYSTTTNLRYYALSGVFAVGVAPSTEIALSVSPDSVAENLGARSVTVTATLNGAARGTATAVTVSDGATGTAMSGTDYAAVNNFTLTIAANETSGTGTFTFTPTDDVTARGRRDGGPAGQHRCDGPGGGHGGADDHRRRHGVDGDRADPDPVQRGRGRGRGDGRRGCGVEQGGRGRRRPR